MRILYATMQYGLGYTQGTERHLAMLTAGMLRRGHHVQILGGDPEGRGAPRELGALLSTDPDVLAYPTQGRRAVVGLAPALLKPLLAQLQPDLIHVCNPAHIGVGLFYAARDLRIPVVVTVHDYWWVCPKHTLRHFTGAVCDGDVTWRECVRCDAYDHPSPAARRLARTPGATRLILPGAFLLKAMLSGTSPAETWRWIHRREILAEVLAKTAAVIFPSRTAQQTLNGLVPMERVHLIPNGLEPTWFEPVTPERPPVSRGATPGAPVPPEKLVIGIAGALVEHKGAHVVLEALQQLGWRQTRVRIAGGGDAPAYQQRLRRLADDLSVEFLGAVPSTAMPRFLSELDVLVVPSVWLENHPIIVLEAAAQHVPVLASNLGGLAEMLDPRSLFTAGDPAALGSRLAAWAAGDRVARPAPVSTADDMVERTLAVYARIVKANSATQTADR